MSNRFYDKMKYGSLETLISHYIDVSEKKSKLGRNERRIVDTIAKHKGITQKDMDATVKLQEEYSNSEKKFCKGWRDLEGLENHKYRIEVEECGGFIVSKEGFYQESEYLSSHTFYGSTYKEYERKLNEYGFNVELDNWDKIKEG